MLQHGGLRDQRTNEIGYQQSMERDCTCNEHPKDWHNKDGKWGWTGNNHSKMNRTNSGCKINLWGTEIQRKTLVQEKFVSPLTKINNHETNDKGFQSW